MADNQDSMLSVGYKKPPRHTQFKPGQSGNGKGRPKGAKNVATALQKELGTKIEVTENGRRRRISKTEAIVKQMVNKAAGGDLKATAAVWNEVRPYENQTEALGARNAVVNPEDQMIMNNILRRIRQANPAVLAPEPPTDPPSEDQPLPPPQANEGDL